MVGDGVHLLELSKMNVAEASSLGFRLSNLSTRGIEHLLSFIIPLILQVFLGLQLGFNPVGFFSDIVHHLLSVTAQRRLRSKGESKSRGARRLSRLLILFGRRVLCTGK